MSDLIERLRESHKAPMPVTVDAELCWEAADEIERLTAERDRQYDQNCEQIVHIAKLQAVVDAAKWVSRKNNAINAQSPRYCEGLQQLREALAALETDDD